jgi:hypothetical protein
MYIRMKFHLGPWVRVPKMVCMPYTHINVIYQFSENSGKKTSKVYLYAKAVINKMPRKKQHVYIIQRFKLPF